MKIYIFILISFSLIYFGCVDAVTSPNTPTTTSGDTQNPTIALSYPLSNDTLQLGSNQFLFDAKDDVGVRAVELWIDSTYKTLLNYDGTTTTQKIVWTIDSTYLGKTIKYFLRVYDKSGKSTDSPTQTNIYIAKVSAPPNAPTNLVLVKLSGSIVNLSWKHDHKNVDGFRIYRRLGETGIYTKLKETDAGSFNTNVDGVDPAYVYYYKVVAFNVKGESSSTNEVSTGSTGSGSTIAAPTNLSAIAAGSKKVILTWQDNSNNENYFVIQRKTFYTDFQSVGLVEANATAFSDSGNGLVPNTDYTYRIEAVSDNDSVFSSSVNTKTLAYDLQTPINVKALNHNSKTIRIVWTDNNQYEMQTIIERRTSSSFTYTIIGSVAKDVTQYDDGDVVSGLTYFYRIRVADYVNFSNYSTEVSATPQPALIVAPTNLAAYYATGNIIKLAWKDNASNETNYVIERASDSTLTNFTEIGKSEADIAQYDDATTVGGVTYAYRVRATDGVVYSTYSNVITIKNPSR